MNRRLHLLVVPAASAVTALLILGASVPWFAPSASETVTVSLQEAATAPATRLLAGQEERRARRIGVPFQVLAAETLPASVLPVLDRSEMTSRHRALTLRTLLALPPACRTHLRTFYVRYGDASRRGLGGKTTIILDGTVPEEEFVSLLVHECAHVTHGNLPGTPSAGDSVFRDGHDRFYADSPAAAFFAISWETERVLRREARTEDFISGYAKADAFEDFAETFAAYVLHREMLAQRAAENAALAAKLAWMETHLSLPADAIAQSLYVPGRVIPWDITKLAIALKEAKDYFEGS